MSTTTLDGTAFEQAAFPRPAWATKSYYPEDGTHTGEVTVGEFSLTLDQVIAVGGEPSPVLVWLPEGERKIDAQGCRDFAAALMEAAQIIDNA